MKMLWTVANDAFLYFIVIVFIAINNEEEFLPFPYLFLNSLAQRPIGFTHLQTSAGVVCFIPYYSSPLH
jgi:uncharacterized integral membrane protein